MELLVTTPLLAGSDNRSVHEDGIIGQCRALWRKKRRRPDDQSRGMEARSARERTVGGAKDVMPSR
ncbi:MAG TPA: hypothetical protein PK614_01035 [Nitrospira sp.]|nr:hypothetical protein [Nitrospira sp.]